ncbi:MAG: HAD hydrolase-like protein [Planctomycetaceae bacterium]|jgi:histidinol phosphatase-like enzyme|nr:HAD hydrolase-like protein [Planctomycetaceae bacterium]
MSTPRRTPRPIPGTEPIRRALFIKRWGTLLERPAHGFAPFSECHFTAGALDALFRLGGAGWNLYLVGNEDEVAQGRVLDGEWEAFERGLNEHLHKLGIPIRRNYVCVDDPNHGSGAHRKGSVFRLPDTGLFFHAQQQDGISLRHSLLVGDSTVEVAAGTRAGCRTIGVRTGHACADRQFHVEPDIWTRDLTEALALVQRSQLASSRAA